MCVTVQGEREGRGGEGRGGEGRRGERGWGWGTVEGAPEETQNSDFSLIKQ